MPPLLNSATCYLGSTPVGAIYCGSVPLVSGGIRSAILAAFPPAASLPNTVLLKKLRTDYPEFAVYAPIDASGINWVRWWFTNRFNFGATAATRMLRATLAKLYTSNAQPPLAENLLTMTQALAPTVAQGTSAATERVGTWVASGTVNGMTDIRYSVNPGDYSEYTITGSGRLQLRSVQNTANAGIIDITIKDGTGALVADSRLMQPHTAGVMTINLKPSSGGASGLYLPLAEGLESDTYAIRVTVNSANPATMRGYDGGPQFFASTPLETTGTLGTFEARTVGAYSMPTTLYPGSLRMYSFTGTKMSWRYGGVVNAGQVSIKIFNAVGTQVHSSTVDTYNVTTAMYTANVASGLPAGTYYVRIQSLATKNASSSGYRVYDYGLVTYDETQAGVPGTDIFDDRGASDSTLLTGDILIGTGNLELAIKARRPGDPAGDTAYDDFCGGIHSNETAPSGLAFSVDGTTIDFAGAALNAQWVGAKVSVSFSTDLKFKFDGATFASATYAYEISRAGYQYDVGRTYTAAAIVTEDYSMMFSVPSRQYSNYGYGGGCNRMLASPDDQSGDRAYPDVVDGTNYLPQRLTTAYWFNDAYAASAQQLNWAEIDAAFSGASLQSSRPQSQAQTRTDGYIKEYNRCFPGSSTGVSVPVGTSGHNKAIFRVALRA